MSLAGLAQDLGADTESFDEARSRLRITILAARRVASREQALGIAELHLAWLLSAREAGAGDCLEVTGKSFFGGVPHMCGTGRRSNEALRPACCGPGISQARAATPIFVPYLPAPLPTRHRAVSYRSMLEAGWNGVTNCRRAA